jgi:putative membrane protein
MRTLAFALAGVALAALGGYVRWLTTRWWVADDGGIQFRRGLIWTKATGVPLARVQSIDIERGPVQRLFGIQALHVQTGGGGKRGEIVLDAVGPEVVEALRALLAERETQGTGEDKPTAPGPDSGSSASQAPAVARGSPAIERRLTDLDLLRAALTAGQFGVLLPVLAVFGQLAENMLAVERGQAVLGLLPDSAVGWITIGVVLGLVAWLLSIVGTLVAFAGFVVTRDGSRLWIRRGFLVHREVTVPIERVHAVEVIEGVLRRPFRLASLRIEVIGHAAEPAAAQTLFPLLRRSEVYRFLATLLPEMADEPSGLEPLPRRALRRYLLPPMLAGLALGAAVWTQTDVGVWALLVALPAIGYGAARYRAAGWRLADGRLAIRSLRLARTTVLAPVGRRESHTFAQTQLQRRGDLADLAVDFGKATRAKIRHLDATVAADVFAAIRERPPTGGG